VQILSTTLIWTSDPFYQLPNLLLIQTTSWYLIFSTSFHPLQFPTPSSVVVRCSAWPFTLDPGTEPELLILSILIWLFVFAYLILLGYSCLREFSNADNSNCWSITGYWLTPCSKSLWRRGANLIRTLGCCESCRVWKLGVSWSHRTGLRVSSQKFLFNYIPIFLFPRSHHF